MQKISTSNKYQSDAAHLTHNGKSSIISRLAYQTRQNIYEQFMHTMNPQPLDSIVDIGVTNEITPAGNVLEQLYPHRNQITCAGITEGSTIEKAYPGVKHTFIEPHQSLPFPDKTFTIGYSNSVLEHVGTRSQQKQFLQELCRVSSRAFVVIPNRWFPIEHHSVLPLLHYFPPTIFRALLRHTHYQHWSYEANLNHLTRKDFISCWPDPSNVITYYTGLGWGAFSSNVVGYTKPS